MKKKMDPRLTLVTAMTVFGTLGLFVRNIPVSSGELALYRAVLAALLLAAFFLVTGQKIPFAKIKKEVPLLLASGVAMGIIWILLFEAYKYTTVSAATLSYYFAPVIVTVVCPLLFKEKLTGRQILCFIMSTVGLVLITGIGDMGGEQALIGILSEKIKECGIRSMVVTLGSAGAAFVASDGERGYCPTRPVDVVDTTGAGDAFFAGVAAGLTYGKTLEEACKIGTLLATSCISSDENVCRVFSHEESGL